MEIVLPEYLYPHDPLLRLSTLYLALLLDYLYPYHRGIMLTLHPVHTSYMAAKRLGKPYSSRARGVAVWLIVVLGHILVYSSILYVAWTLSPILWVLASAYILKTSFSLKLLIDIAEKIAHCSSAGDWRCARSWTQMIVRRNVYELDEQHVLSAAIESLAESLVDGFTSPLFYYPILGPIGALLQRLANTLDGALGFKTPEYRNVGWFSAKMDTIINYVPARLTALTIILSCMLTKNCSHAHAHKTWRRYASKTESLNAGHPMSAMAGALRVQLEKPGHYTLGEPLEEITPDKLLQAINLAKKSATIWLLATTVATALLP